MSDDDRPRAAVGPLDGTRAAAGLYLLRLAEWARGGKRHAASDADSKDG